MTRQSLDREMIPPEIISFPQIGEKVLSLTGEVVPAALAIIDANASHSSQSTESGAIPSIAGEVVPPVEEFPAEDEDLSDCYSCQSSASSVTLKMADSFASLSDGVRSSSSDATITWDTYNNNNNNNNNNFDDDDNSTGGCRTLALPPTRLVKGIVVSW